MTTVKSGNARPTLDWKNRNLQNRLVMSWILKFSKGHFENRKYSEFSGQSFSSLWVCVCVCVPAPVSRWVAFCMVEYSKLFKCYFKHVEPGSSDRLSLVGLACPGGYLCAIKRLCTFTSVVTTHLSYSFASVVVYAPPRVSRWVGFFVTIWRGVHHFLKGVRYMVDYRLFSGELLP